MYATNNNTNTKNNTNDTNVTNTSDSIAALFVVETLDPQLLRRTLDAIYREHGARLRELARHSARKNEDAGDAVQDAFLRVLERPPLDTRKPALTRALEQEVRIACEAQRRGRRDEDAMKVGLRKRHPI